MWWNRKVDRLFKVNKDKKESTPDIYDDEYYDPNEDRIEPTVGDNLEKGDLFAMIVSAWITIVPISIGILVGIVLLAWLLLGLF
ncbi:hypothetical protein NXH67_10005 [Butyrivibrio sp. DSM 10294]|uniref:hypothetical protein n=1 Tax=Butyrivibrio sp. DSM 10294 TaxID=2972457 RepID=UPI00234F832D|nr:hypothetical protein [Butyrivibrio sp. DSM 10294]MDC7293846.1 hypothetical protein [Butyrivibrio sp. DSM 10294]